MTDMLYMKDVESTYIREFDAKVIERGFDYVMMYLCGMEDEGLIVLPTHRLVTRTVMTASNEFMDQAARYFTIERLSLKRGDHAGRAEEAVHGLLEAGRRGPSVGLYTGADNSLHILTLKAGLTREVFAADVAEPLQGLDVMVLTEVIFAGLLGLRTNNGEDMVSYSHDTPAIMAAAEKDDRTWAFLLNPTRIEQVRRVATAGLVMPHKSTFFYPKIVTGLVMNKI